MAFKVFAFGSSDGDIQKHWTYDSHQYPYNMTMIGAIQIDGEEQQSEYLEIGAFCGGECRGSELLAYYPAVEKYLVFLTVYGSNDDEITFKLYDHQTEAELDLENQQAVPFSANAFFGNPNEPYLFGFNSDVTWLSITANVMPEGSGYVNGYDSFYGNFTYGSTCTLEASPEWNYQFLYWMKDGVQVSTSATYSFTVTEDANYTAYFVLGSYINPYWTYNSHLYEHSMTMIGIVKIDGEEQRSPYLEIGAFCESECRGSTLMQYIPTLDRYLAFLTVFGNDENIINFRLFDHYNGYEVDRMAPSFSFAADAICGNPDEPYVFNFTDFLTITTQLQPAAAGTVTGGGEYMPGTTCTLTAVPISVYSFVNWTKDGVVVSYNPTYSFVVTDNAIYTANFEWNNPGGDYIADGLIMYLDGIYNTRDGHASSTNVWEDLIGNNDLAVTGYSSYTWEDNHFFGLGNAGYLNTGKTWQYFNSQNNDITIEIVTYIDCDKVSPPYRGLVGWHTGSNGTNCQNDQGYGKMQTLGQLPVSEADNTISTVSYTRTNGSFLNGEWETDNNNISSGINSYHIVVFGNSYAESRGWNDSIYCIRMYNKTLTPEEIAHNHSIDMERFGAVPHSVDTTLLAEICYGDDYLLNGFEIIHPEVGEDTYSIELTSMHGADSIVYLTLTVNPVFFTEQDTSLCEMTPFLWHGKTLTESGIYYDSLQTIHGCDSIYALSLELFNTPLGEFASMTPTNNYPFTSLPITFSWDAVSGAEYYDLYVWDADEQIPEESLASGLRYGNYSTSALQNYHTYNWFVKARNACYEMSSSVKSFYLDITPSLNVNVNHIDFGEVAMNQSTSTTLNVTGIVLEDELDVQITGEDAAMFSFTQASGWNDYNGGILIVTFNPTTPQYDYNANLVVSSGTLTETVTLTGAVSDLYVFNTYVTEDVYAMNTQIPIYGSVTDWNNAPVTDAEVEIGVFVMGMKRTLQAMTDNSGQFSAVFEPMPSESGYYTVNSGRVGNHSTAAHDDFNIPGMTLVSSDYILCAVTQDQPKTDSILIRNKSNLNLSNIQVSPISIPDGASFSFMPLSLSGLEENWLVYTVTGSTLTQGNYYEEARLKATSSEGAEMNLSIWYYCMEPRGVLDVMPKSLVTTMTKGKSKIVDVMLTNNGTAATGNITIDLPDVEWMSVVGNDTLSSIAVNDTAYFSLRFSPAEDIQLGQYSGTIAINSERGDAVALPYTITAVSDSTGFLVIDVTDDFTWNTNNGNGPHLEGAEVTLKGYYSLETVAYGFTDVDGHFSVEDLPEGYYRLSVTAERHSDYNGVVFVEAGATERNYTDVYLQYQAITYSWMVEPTEIQDEYTYELDVVFETHVPAPVVVIDISPQVPELDYDESYTFNAIVTNYGLIAAKGFQLEVPISNEYIFNALLDEMDSLPALTTIVIPVTVTRVQTGRYEYPPEYPYPDDHCNFRLGAKMYYVCGRDWEHNQDRYVWHHVNSREVFVNRCILNALANALPQLPCLWCGGGSGSSGGGSHNDDEVPPEEHYEEIGCHPCDNLLGNLASYTPLIGAMEYSSGFIGGNHHDAIDDIRYWGGQLPVLSEIEGLVSKGELAGDLAAYIHCSLEHQFVQRNQNLELQDIEYVFRLNDDMFEMYNELYIDSTLYYQNGFDLFNSLMLDYYTNLTNISETEAMAIKSNMYDLDVPIEAIEDVIVRWNNTVDAWNDGVFEPDFNHPDIINKIRLDSIGNDIYDIYDQISIIGYSSIYEMMLDLYDVLGFEINKMSNSVCSTVKVRFSQNMTMTREAFDGTLTIHNGHPTDPIEAINVNLVIKDSEGVDCTSLFQINTLSLNNITGIDGTGSIGGGMDGTAKIQFIPTRLAAPTSPKVYYFGGSFSFIDPYSGEEILYDLFPVEITVNPSPDLYVDYFMQRDILGDDALTLDVVEPSVPAELGVIIHNQGAGMAKNVLLETAEPQIIDNEKGLAIDFAMYGASFNGSPRQLGLMEIPFGNIESGQTAVGEWLFTSSLLGHFVSYEAHVIHNNSYGNPDLSLVSHLDIHELIHPIYAYGNLDDGINDFLVNDNPDAYDMPDSIYFSHGGKTSVDVVDNISFDHYVEPLDTIVTLTINPSRIGWNYGVTNDPGRDKYELVSCTRNFDNQIIPLNNVWQTFVTIPDGGDPIYENKLHIVDTLSNDVQDFTYTLVYSLKNNLLDVLEITGIPESYIDYPLESFTVRFNEAIIDSTFTYEDMTLKCQNGPNLMDSTVVITKVSDSIYDVNISGLTSETGLYVLNISTLNIKDVRGHYGYKGKQASWVQVITNHTQTCTLASGWNWWSTYIDATTEQVFDMLKSELGSNASMIKSKADGFVSYMGDWYGTLLAINNKEMYMIDMNSDQTVEISGLPADLASNPITIWNGWNWIGFPSDVSVDLNSALANMTPEDSDLIKSRNAYATYYSSMGSWFGTLTELTPGMGYMYKSNNEDPFEFVYSTSSRDGQEPPEIQMTNHWDVSVGEYSDNATLIGVIAINGEEQRNDNLVVGAFVGDRCVGETNVMYIEPLDRYFVFLTYFGNENDAITFRLYDGDSGIETIGEETTIVFNPNSVIGAMDDPYIINFGTLGMDEFAKEIKLFPNPVEANGKVNVSLKVDGVTGMRIEIVNTLGVAVCQDTYHTNAADIKAPRVPGIYIVKMTGDNGLVYYGKLIVE